MLWVRVDNRLVHGQIIETWIPFTKSRTIIVANDDVKNDVLRQEIMGLAIPSNVEKVFLAVDEVHDYMERIFASSGRDPDVIVLFANCTDARRAHENGMAFKALNLGNMHYAAGKEQLCPHVALDDDDRDCLAYFDRTGVDLDFRCVPNEPVLVGKVW